MYLCNSSFVPRGTTIFDDHKPFCVIGHDGVITTLPDIDNSLCAEDFNVSVQQSLGANLSFNASYVPSDKLQDFEGIVNYADSLLSSEVISEPSTPSQPSQTSQTSES